jgi:hypothetical protein
MNFPAGLPKDNCPAVWTIQNELLLEVEQLLGKRDQAKTIGPPTFEADGPRIRNSLNLDRAWAELSSAASGYWPTLIYELAHESVHLLNPIAGHTTWLEEGIAVAFSIHAQKTRNVSVISPPIQSNYGIALELVNKLPGGPFDFGKAVRARFGSLHGFSGEDLIYLYPMLTQADANRLSETCIPR